MRNLKRALSLALASVMVLGLMVVGSGASYADVTSEENQEAIEVLQAVGVMVGDDEGNFNPDKNVTRNEMAVVMSNLLDLKVEDFNAADIPFTDVPSWAVSYVAACYADGITSGTSATTYGGNNTVTAAQAALMMMKALGYFQYQGDFEQDWTLATIKKGSEIGIFKGVTVDRVSPLTRNDVAQMALKSNMVLFTGDVGIEIPSANGPIVVGYNPEYTARTSANSKYNQISAGTTDIASNNQYYVQLGEELYNGDLELSNRATDDFGRPANYWEYDGKEIGTYVNYGLLMEEYTTEVTGKDLYDLLGSSTIKDYDLTVVIDGVSDSKINPAVFAAADMNKNNKDGVGDTGNGVLTQVFVDTADKQIVISIINTYLAIADDDYNEKKDEASFDVYGLYEDDGEYIKRTDDKYNNDENMPVDNDDINVEDVLEGDFVLVTYSYESEEIESISDVEILSDLTITRFTSDDVGGNKGNKVSSVTAEGTKYDASNTLTYEDGTLKDYTNSNLKDKTYNIYLDQYGYAIGVEEVEGADNYLFLTGINTGDDYLSTANYDANVIFLDGTSEVVKVKSNAAVQAAITAADSYVNGGDGKALVNTWFKYSVNSNDVYTLSTVQPSLTVGGVDYTVAQHRTPKSAIPGATIDDRHISLVGGANERIYGTEDTVYLVAGLDTVTVSGTTYGVIADADEVITGVDNASIEVMSDTDVVTDFANNGVTIADKTHTVGGAYALYDDDGVVIAAVVVGESAGTSSSVAYVISSKASEERFEDGVWGWTREVVIDGELVDLNEVDDDDTISILADEMRQGQWYTVKFDADGNVKKYTPYNGSTETGKYANDFPTAVNQLRKQDLVVLEIDDNMRVNYSTYGRSLFDWTGNATNVDDGIFAIEDVKFVIRQENKNKTTTEEYVGWNQLKSALDNLNEDPDNWYGFSAVIDNGRITSVVIEDKNPDSDYERPDGNVGGNGLEEGVALTGTDTITVTDRYESGKSVEELVREWAIARNIKNLEINGTTVSGIRGDSDVFYTMNVVTAYKVAIEKAPGANVRMSAPSYVWADANNGVSVNVTLTLTTGNWAGETPTVTTANPDGTTGYSVSNVVKNGGVMTFTLGISSSGGNDGVVTVAW